MPTTIPTKPPWVITTLVGIFSLLICPHLDAASNQAMPGLVLTFAAEGTKASDLQTAPTVALHVEAGRSPSPFLPAGKFTAVWSGAINAELRGNHSFEADLQGTLKVEINGAVVIEATGTHNPTHLSKSIQLSKGPNAFKATFTSPAEGDAQVRLSWTEKPPFTSPIPSAAFTHVPSPDLARSSQLHAGRELFLNHRCAQCHTDSKVTESGVPELKSDAPAFEGIGSRRNYDWMARWIRDPKALRPTAQMPKLLAGPKATEDAEAIAAYLASLKGSGDITIDEAPYQTRQNQPAEGENHAGVGEPKPLYEKLHCVGCHNPPGEKNPDPAKISQQHLAEKFPSGKLAAFLRAPEQHYSWTRMPNFFLDEKEAKELEEWLLSASPKTKPSPAPTDPALLDRGRKLVQTTGCLNCHAAKLDNEFKAPSLPSLHSRHLAKRAAVPAGDCLGKTPFADFAFTARQRAALDAFTLAGFGSLSRHVPTDFAERQIRELNCAACHGQVELIPPLEILGAKLKPEWSARFIGGEIRHKVRFDAHPKGEPWVEARMPAFKSRARLLAPGMAQQHGYSPQTTPERPVDPALAEVGRKLVGKEGGFSCVSCHGVGPLLALEVFESEGPNLALSADRLFPDYYRRWFRAPTSIDPQTKMPVYFDEGKSPLTDVLDGDGEKQISAVWEYLKQRDQMLPPKVGEQ